jgi:radical SAM superfamily enzyme YgiQ (UPF0313 family)
MHITFIYLDFSSDDPNYTGYFVHGLAALSAILKKHGYRVSLIQITKEIPAEEFQRRIKILNPDLVGFTSTTHIFPFVRKYAAITKKITKVPIICGGVHPTICPEDVLRDKNIDMICRGECDAAIVELCQKLEKGEDIKKIDNIWVKEKNQIFKNPIRPLISNLDNLPFPDREIFDYPQLNLEKQGIGTFMLSRGCPYQCAFCSESTLRKLYPNPNNYFRFRSPRSSVEEIKTVISKYPFIKFIRFDDDLLFANKE